MRAAWPIFCSVAASCVGCGPLWSNYPIEERIQEIREESGTLQAVQSGPTAADREIVVAAPAGLVFFLAYDEEKGVAEVIGPIAMWDSPDGARDAKEFAESERDAYEAKNGEGTVRGISVFPDFGAGVREALARRARASNLSLVVRTDAAAQPTADFVISLVRFSFAPPPPQKPTESTVVVGLQATANDLRKLEGGTAIESGAAHLAWAIPAMLATFPLCLAWVPPILRVIKEGNEAESLALSIDKTMDEGMAFIIAARTPAGGQSAAALPADQPGSAVAGCTKDRDCAGDLVCENGSCAEPGAKPAAKGCSKDRDCKGDRICEGGRCIEP